MSTRDEGGRRLDAVLHLLDRQLVDRDGRLTGKVDDLDLTPGDDGRLVVTAILTGPGAFGPRLPGLVGRTTLAWWRRLHPDADPQPVRLPMSEVSEIGSAVKLAASRADLPNEALENWARGVVSRLPGAGHAPE